METISHIVQQSKVIICLGPGGVGKTSLSTALAILAAQQGKKVALCTIDPSQRLKDTLGITPDATAFDPQPLPQKLAEKFNIDKASIKSLFLNEHSTLKAFLTRQLNAKDAQNIISHPWYPVLGSRLAGIREYLAMDILVTLVEDPQFDLVILDTPPTNHSMEFMQTPNRFTHLFDNDIFKKFLTPISSKASSFSMLGGSFIFRVLSSFTGKQTLQNIASFTILLRMLILSLAKRLQTAQTLFHDQTTHFIMITTPSSASLHESQRTKKVLNANELSISHLVINRIMQLPEEKPEQIFHDIMALEKNYMQLWLQNQIQQIHQHVILQQKMINQLYKLWDKQKNTTLIPFFNRNDREDESLSELVKLLQRK